MNNISATEFENKAAPRVIVSLTTYPGRIDRVNIAIESLLHQTRKADMIVLWLAEEQFPGKESSLPEQLLTLREQGLRIEWCKDIKSFKKLIPSLEKWPDDIIITADDDIIYRADTIENLLNSYERHPQCVSTVRAHLMLFDECGAPLPYNDWKPEYSEFIDRPLMSLFPTTGAGTLFPPGILPEETSNEDAFMTLCPKADDIWTKCMLTLAGVPVVLACENTRLLYVEGTQSETLYSHNLTGNDDQLAAVLDVYNEVGGEEYPEETLLSRMNDLSGHKPDNAFCQKYRVSRSYANENFGIKISIIIAAKNAEKTIRRCIASAIGQSEQSIEIICVDAGSNDNTAALMESFTAQDQRVRFVGMSGACSLTEARRAAVLDCRGEYCIFPEADGVLAPDACEQLYKRAEEGDADILAFTRGVLMPGEREPNEVFGGYRGRLRNKNIMPNQFCGDNIPLNELHSCIFGARLCRKTYIHASADRECSSLYDYFLLCHNAEVYVGEKSPVYYAAQADEIAPEDVAEANSSIAKYAVFAKIYENYASVIDGLRRKCIYEYVLRWMSFAHKERGNYMNMLTRAWGREELSAALHELYRDKGPAVVRAFGQHGFAAKSKGTQFNVGVAVLEGSCAADLFNMTEVLDCIAVMRPTVLIGVSKAAASAVVSSAKAVFAGAELSDETTEDEYVFAQIMQRVMEENDLNAVVIQAHSRRYMQTAMLAKLMGISVVAMMTEPLCLPMASCSQPESGLCGLELADVIVSDSQNQVELMCKAGLNARYIPLPDIRLMGGRTSGRATANTVVWAGSEEELGDAYEIFSKLKAAISAVKMQAYVDGINDIEPLSENAPEGVSVRRMRPDHGIFSDAAVQLMTRRVGTVPAALRAAATLGVPTVMYSLPGENNTHLGAVETEPGDTASAAQRLAELLQDKDSRDRLGAEAKSGASANSREMVAARWHDVLQSIDAEGEHSDTDSLGSTLAAMLAVYEDGAYANACCLEDYRLRCENYERQLVQAEERRVKEIEALQAELEKQKAALREKEHARSAASRQLDEVTSSTIYKVGSLVTAVPRKLKKFISGGK